MRSIDLNLAVWRQRERDYVLPPSANPIISVHIRGQGYVRLHEANGWSRRSSTIGTVTYLPPGVNTRWRVEGGEVSHVTVSCGAESPLRDIITDTAYTIEVGLPDALNVSLARQIAQILETNDVVAADEELFLSSLCETLLRNFGRQHPASYRIKESQASCTCDITNRAIATLETRFAEPVSVSDLAREAGLSTPHFARTFKKFTGLTPHQYLLRIRIERVREALLEGAPLAGIAQNLGFSSQSHLNSVFRKITGMTPTQFRNQAKS